MQQPAEQPYAFSGPAAAAAGFQQQQQQQLSGGMMQVRCARLGTTPVSRVVRMGGALPPATLPPAVPGSRLRPVSPPRPPVPACAGHGHAHANDDGSNGADGVCQHACQAHANDDDGGAPPPSRAARRRLPRPLRRRLLQDAHLPQVSPCRDHCASRARLPPQPGRRGCLPASASIGSLAPLQLCQRLANTVAHQPECGGEPSPCSLP